MNHYPRHIGDYLRDTAHLSLLEHGVYGRLLDLYYLNDGPIPGDLVGLCRKIGARSGDEKAAVEAVVAEFFAMSDAGLLTHKRCDQVLSKYKIFGEQQRERALKRYSKPADGMPESTVGMPTAAHNLPTAVQTLPTATDGMPTHGMPTINHKPITNNHKPTDNPPTPRKRGKPATAGVPVSVDWFEGLLPELDVEHFRDRWLEWVEYRRQLKEPVNPATLRAVFRVIARMGLETFMAQSENAMANGWVGFQHKIKGANDDHRSEKRSREFTETIAVPDLNF
jgi:uncharacterized protein YdaU (DUF1376 family)